MTARPSRLRLVADKFAGLFRPRRKPLALHRLPWKSLGCVRNLALGIDAATRSGGRYGLENRR